MLVKHSSLPRQKNACYVVRELSRIVKCTVKILIVVGVVDGGGSSEKWLKRGDRGGGSLNTLS